MGWCQEALKNQRNISPSRVYTRAGASWDIKLTRDNLWFCFLTLVKASQSAYPPVIKQDGVFSVNGLSLLLTRSTSHLMRLCFGISGLPLVSTAHAILVRRIIEDAHVLVKHERGVVVEQHLSLTHTLRAARAGT